MASSLSRPGTLRPTAVLGVVALTLAACAPPSVNEFKPRDGDTQVLAPMAGRAAFWTAFRDPQLDRLMQAGLTQNLSLREAVERITEAGAEVGVPRQFGVEGDLSVTRAKSQFGTIGSSRSAVLGGTWLVDIFGGPSNQRAAEARRDAAYFSADDVRLALASEIAANYIELRYAQAVIAFTQRSIGSRRQSRESISSQFEAGAATRLDVLRADQRLAVAEAQLPALEIAAERAVNRLATLTASTPQSLRGLLNRGAAQPAARWSGSKGIAADTIRLRPDVQAAERTLVARASEVGVARAALLPSITLAGQVSVPGSGATTWAIGPSINLPFLTGGRNRAAVTAAESRARQAYLAWQRTVFEAVEDVQNALAAYSRDARNVGAQQRLVAISQETVDLARSSYDLGETDFLSILDAEVELLDARRALAAAERDRAINFVRLNIATAGSVLPPR